jgi:mannose-6-phosphate isomerase-like protein (cupin superfamily)
LRKYNLKNFKGGWVAGNFEPTIFKTNKFEVSVKSYKKGEYQDRHIHKEAEEVSIIIQGSAKMNGKIYKKNDIILIEKNEATDFMPLEDNTTTCVIKTPSVIGDKYLTNDTDFP